MDIFSESQMSFKMNMKSPLASMLKSSISDKLVQFLGDCTDDVLAEYIIVLVRNGKHQIQARDDLEAFLGDKSGEFVSWLWDHLLKYAHQSDSAIGLIDPKDITVTCSHKIAERDLRRTRSKDVQNHGNGDSDSLLIKNLILKGPVAPVNEVKTNTVQSEKQRSRNPGEVGATENFHDGSSSQNLSRIGCSSLIPTVPEQSFECIDRSKIVSYKGSDLPCQLVDFPSREIVSRKSEPSTIEPYTGQMYAGNISARSPPRAVEELSCGSKKPRGSVWDRLGKPCEETVVINDNKTVDPLAVAVFETEKEVSDLNTLLVPVPNSVGCGSMKTQGHDLDKSGSGNNTGEHRKLEVGASMMSERHAANNIGQKRHFGGISSDPSSCSVSLLGRRKIQHYNETSKDSKRSNSKSEAAAPALVSQAQDMKVKLHKIEREMFKLRTKQLEMKKDGQPQVSSNSGVIKHSEEDVKSRTVFVTNVHFAATKEALSLHFAKCGVVLSVVILTDIFNGQPKGSAYITFANKESVEKAVALSGTSFFSRIVKVARKVDEAAVGNTPPQHAGKPSQAQSSQMNITRPFYPSSHLQWCREPLSAPSEPST